MGVIIAFFHIPGTQATDSNCVNIRVSGKAMKFYLYLGATTHSRWVSKWPPPKFVKWSHGLLWFSVSLPM